MSAAVTVFSILMPMSHELWQIYIFAMFNNIGIGAFESGTTTWLIEMWQQNSSPVLQLSKAFCGLGTIFGPMLDTPYILGKITPDNQKLGNYTSRDDAIDAYNEGLDRRPQLEIPYLVGGLIESIIPISLIIMFIFKRYQFNPKDMAPNIQVPPDSRRATLHSIKEFTIQEPKVKQSPVMKWTFVALIAFSLSTYGGFEMLHIIYSPTYYQYIPLKLSAQKAAEILSVSSTTLTIGKLISAFIALKVKAHIMISYHIIILAVSMCILYFGQNSELMIWIGNILIGFGFSCVWPAYFQFGEDFVGLTDAITSIFSFGSQIFPLLSPIICGPLIEKNPNVFLLLELAYFATTCLIFYMFGAVMVDLRYMFHTTTTLISYTNTFGSVGYMIGSFVGFAYKYVNRQFTLIFMSALVAVFGLVQPMCTQLWQIYLCSMLFNIGISSFDTGTTVWAVEMWQQNCAPVLQLAKALGGIGMVISPLLTKPFILGRVTPDNSTLKTYLQNITSTATGDEAIDEYNYSLERKSQLEIPFIISGALNLIVPISMALMFVFKRYYYEENELNSHLGDTKGVVPEGRRSTVHSIKEYTIKKPTVEQTPLMKWTFVLLIATSLSTYNGMESLHLVYSSTYYQYSGAKMTAQTAADVLSVMNAALTIGKLISALIALKLKAHIMLSYHFVLLAISMVILYFGRNSALIIWIGNVVIGLAFSCIWPSFFQFGEDFIGLSDTVASGVVNSMFAPTMNDMKFMFRTSMQSITLVCTCLSGGYLIGSFVATAFMNVFAILMPFCPNIWLLYLSTFLNSVGCGAWDCSNAVWTIEMWGNKSPAFLQLSQMMFGLGSILAPIIARPYLIGDLSEGIQTTTTPTIQSQSNSTETDDINYSIDRRPLLIMPYLISGGAGLIGQLFEYIVK
ncbi:uncharacterized protein LOC128964056 [Oppia nitens]|uniref:uncharacterized protein LOC128964056 n=1 Tax=Oppia nitens TaxID=1686743 RepID=UPI0023DC7687|nr:uncharacterized protein LOC128964056 [Oppia nitens]